MKVIDWMNAWGTLGTPGTYPCIPLGPLTVITPDFLRMVVWHKQSNRTNEQTDPRNSLKRSALTKKGYMQENESFFNQISAAI